MVVDKITTAGKATTIAYFVLAVSVVALIALVLAARPSYADAAVFTVDRSDDPDLSTTQTADDCVATTASDCSLRGAITAANSNSNPTEQDIINFGIPGSGVHTITPSSTLPPITEQVTIDGYTQSGAEENDIPVARDGTNANLLIELNGANAGSSGNGLAINASNVEVRGLVINRFSTGISVLSDGSGAAIEGNFIGTDPSGTQAQANSSAGVNVFGGGANIIGGREAAAHNLISGNFHGLTIATNTGNTIQGNLIGTDKAGTNNLGNGVEGVGISSSDNIVGSAAADNDLDSNLIAFNGGDGVRIGGGTGNRIFNNRIHSNFELGIDLVKNNISGVTKNDSRAKDRDTGVNNLQNFPVISSAITKGNTTTIKGTLKSRPKKAFIIQLFSSPQKDPSGFGEGKEFMGQREVTTNREGRGSFTFETGSILGAFVTATATDPDGNTSEFSKAVVARVP